MCHKLEQGETCNSRITSMTATDLQSFPPEICSLICQDPILERLDLNFICFISHAFRDEAQRELSYRFPILRGASRVEAWSLALQPHLALNIVGLFLQLPRTFKMMISNLSSTLRNCVNLKELAVLLEECPNDSSSTRTYIINIPYHRFKLTKFVNGYFSQDSLAFLVFLRSQPDLESLELHSGKMKVSESQLRLDHLKTLGCSPHWQFLDTSYSMTRLRLNFENSTDNCEIDVLGRVLKRNLTKNMKSLAIFLKQRQSHFSEIIRVIASSGIYVRHLEIHQFVPTQVRP
jgi:hypothetical protein